MVDEDGDEVYLPVHRDEWDRINRELGELYKHFKDSDMTLSEYERRCEAIERPLEHCGIYYDSLIRLRSACRWLGWEEEIVRQTVRHEGAHARLARQFAEKKGVYLKIKYRLDLLSYDDESLIGAGPKTEFTDLENLIGNSKERYIEFMDAMVHEHPDPSEGDRAFM